MIHRSMMLLSTVLTASVVIAAETGAIPPERPLTYVSASIDGAGYVLLAPPRGRFPSHTAGFNEDGTLIWEAVGAYGPIVLVYDHGRRMLVCGPAPSADAKSDEWTALTFYKNGSVVKSYSYAQLLAEARSGEPKASIDNRPTAEKRDDTGATATRAGPRILSQELERFAWLAERPRLEKNGFAAIQLTRGIRLHFDPETGGVVQHALVEARPVDGRVLAAEYEDVRQAAAVAERVNELGSKLALEADASGRSRIVSSYGVASALAVLRTAASTTTRREIDHALGIDAADAGEFGLADLHKLQVAFSGFAAPKSHRPFEGIEFEASPAADGAKREWRIKTAPTSMIASTILRRGDRLRTLNGKAIESDDQVAGASDGDGPLELSVVHSDGSSETIFIPRANLQTPVVRFKNRVWADRSAGLRDSFLEELKRGSIEIAPVDFADGKERRRIADALRRGPAGFFASPLPELDQMGQVPPGGFIAATSVSFVAEWNRPFEPAATDVAGRFKNAEGVVRPCSLMSGVLSIPYVASREARCRAIDVPFRGGRYSMFCVLGDDPLESAGELRKRLGWREMGPLIRAADQAVPERVLVRLPRFSISAAHDESADLKRLGIVTAFKPGEADFSAALFTGGRHVASVVTQARFEVDEYGAEAEAQTTTVVAAIGAAKPKEFTADRPFICGIRDRSTGLVLLWGAIDELEAP